VEAAKHNGFINPSNLLAGDSLLIYFDEYDLLIGVGILCILLPIVWWRKHSLSYLLFFSIFWVYLLAVVQAVIFPIAINTGYGRATVTSSINLVPFYFGSCFSHMPELCVTGIIDNIILTIPFGFGINFLVRVKPRYFFWLALAVGLGFEFSQLLLSIAFRSGFRAVDINDAILNATGVLLGYALFRTFAWAYLKATEHFGITHKWLFADIYDVVIQTQATDRSKNA
jgi:glycopeptide antibiotics resistance protein